MEYLDMETWNRKDQFTLFNKMDYPHFNVCANLDITVFYDYLKKNKLPFLVSMVYLVSRVANEIEPFRYRIRDGKVLIHEQVHPAFTIMNEDEVFGFCPTDYMENFQAFKMKALEEIEKSRLNISVSDEPGRDDMLFLTSLPWVSFTSVTHPIHMSPTDSIPRIGWGKYFQENEKLKMPISVQVHHALMDGLHVGKYYMRIQELLDQPEKCFL